MDYKDCIDWLESLGTFPEVTTFERVDFLLEKFGRPDRKMKYVHITGTNGKGSVCAMTESILRTAGYKTGLFTSPHLFKYNERIKVDSKDISDTEFCALLIRVKGAVEEMILKNEKMKPCLFEVVLVMALIFFAEHGVELAVIEVGCGGRRDATNVIESEVAIITNIDLEHTELLGDTKEKIAKDKAGIIKEGCVCITTETDSRLIKIFAEEAEAKGAKLIVLEPADIELISQSARGQVFNFMDHFNVELTLIGGHQLSNAALAIMCGEVLNTRGFKITEQDIKHGIKTANWPLRLEMVEADGRTFLIDCAHNLHGVKAVVGVIKKTFQKERRKILILGCSKTKPYKEMACLLAELGDEIIVTEAEYNTANADEIAGFLIDQNLQKRVHTTKNITDAMKKALEISKKDDLIMVLGGLYLAAEAAATAGLARVQVGNTP